MYAHILSVDSCVVTCIHVITGVMTMEMDTYANICTVYIPYNDLNSRGQMNRGIRITKTSQSQCTILQLNNLQKVPPPPVVVSMLYYHTSH